MYRPPLSDKQIKEFLCPPCDIVYDELVSHQKSNLSQTLWEALDSVCYKQGIDDFNLGPLSEYSNSYAPWVRIDGEHISGIGMFEHPFRSRRAAAEWILHRVMYILRDRISMRQNIR